MCILALYIIIVLHLFIFLHLLLTEPLSVDCYLKVVRSAIWEIRATWGRLGLHLGIKEGTLDVSVYLRVYVCTL